MFEVDFIPLILFNAPGYYRPRAGTASPGALCLKRFSGMCETIGVRRFR
jgi:hypothetical protein